MARRYADRKLDVNKLLDRFGGPAELVRKLDILGYEPPKQKTIYMWQHRGTIPTGWLLVLHELSVVEGQALDLGEYTVSPEEEGVL